MSFPAPLFRHSGFVICLLSALSGFTFNHASAQQLSTGLINKVKSATVYIEVTHQIPVDDDKEYKSSGTGFFINASGYILTNYHVIQNGMTSYEMNYPTIIKKIKIIQNSGSDKYKIAEAVVFAADKQNDLAILVCGDSAVHPCLDFDTSGQLTETQPVWIFGFPFGDAFSVIQRGPEITVAKGSVAALRHDDRGILTTLQVEGAVNPGNSGGPVVNERGEVAGIINIAYRDVKMNFAVPASKYFSFIRRMAGRQRNFFPVERKPYRISVETDPPGGEVFIDWKFFGASPVYADNMPAGSHSFFIAAEGMKSSMGNWVIFQDTSVTVKLQPVTPVEIPAGHSTYAPETNTGPSIPDFQLHAPQKTESVILRTGSGDLLMEENFNNPEKFAGWEQSTGGTDARTWYIEDEALHQYENNGTLHAIFLGSSEWSDYYVQSSVKIDNEDGDSRAGLIFRETENGFYLFRIHRQSDKAQLAYHSKEPFGWFILDEKKLDRDISGKWYRLAVNSNGNSIMCFLDGNPVLYSASSFSNNGRVGLYSVESRASFDSMAVYAPDDIIAEKWSGISNTMETFWFTDYFNEKSGCWKSFSDEDKPDAWMFTDFGAIQNKMDGLKHSLEFTRYNIKNFALTVTVSLGAPSKDCEFEIFFRKKDGRSLSLVFDAVKNMVTLFAMDKEKKETLKNTSFSERLPSGTFLLTLTVNENRLTCNLSGKEILAVKSKNIDYGSGSFGFSSRGVKTILHRLNVNSITE